MNIKDRMRKIPGITNVTWDSENLTLNLYHDGLHPIDFLKIYAFDKIDKANLHRAIEKINFIFVGAEKS